ncbi:MAG: tetratricopeptide repeat protein [Nocardioidaceae bacterium]|nr:tetratricopeptide repeat protein [Nocardioidaceae bacterium]
MTPEQVRELQALVDEGEFALATRDSRTAHDRAVGVLGSVDGSAPVELVRAANRLRAAAQELDGDLDGAIETLTKLVADPHADEAWVSVVMSLVRCHRDRGEYSKAISVGEDARATIDELGLAHLTEAIQLTVTVAGAVYLRGDNRYAMRTLKRAIEVAERVNSPVALASAYWNASVIEAAEGSREKALHLAKLALSLFEAGDDSRNLGRIRGMVADLQLGLDDPDVTAAVENLDKADLELAWAPVSTTDLARQRLSRCDASLILGDLVDAEAQINECARLAPADAQALNAAVFIRRGQIAAAQFDIDKAKDHYRRATLLLTGAGADHAVAQTWFDLGSVLDELGDRDGAHDAFRSAAAARGLRSMRLGG